MNVKAQRRKPKEGFDGAQLRTETVRISRTRVERRVTRAMPGTFEWRYGRDTSDPLYLAGSHFARLWEKASHLGAGAIDYGSVGGGDWKGLPDGKAVAMQEIGEVMKELGKLCSARLVAYCVQGLTSAEIASRYCIADRDVAPVLNQDLRAVAIHLRFM